MIKNAGWLFALAAGIGIAAAVPASASKPVAIEKELLGVRVLQNYREVLLRYGAPTRIFRATETITYHEAPGTGGVLGINDASASGGMGGNPGMGGLAGGGAPPGMAGGGGGQAQAMARGVPGASTGGGQLAGGSGSSPGVGSQGADNPDASYSESGGFTWVYLYPFKELAYEFRFNKDGRLERISEMGRAFGQHTSRGVGLGDALDRVYGVYGWTDQIKDEGAGKFSLLYNDRYHAQFLILKNKVIGVSVFLKENQFMRFDTGSGGGAGSGAPGMMGGQSQSGMSGGGGNSGPPAGGGAMKPHIMPSGGH